MGANLAGEVAEEKFCETTIGCRDSRVAPLLKDMIQTDYFRVVVVDDEDAVEVCGALKVGNNRNVPNCLACIFFFAKCCRESHECAELTTKTYEVSTEYSDYTNY